MDAVASEEWIENARMLVESARAIVRADGSLDRIREARFEKPGFDRDIMRQAAELGWFLMWVDEQAGGLGLGMGETCELMRVLGAGLVPEPILSSIMACALLQSETPETVLTGETVVVTAWQDELSSQTWHGGAAGDRLAGTKVHVPGAAGADCLAVVTGQGVALVPRDADGLSLSLDESSDGAFWGTVDFENVEARFRPAESVVRILENARLAHSAYLLGLAERAFDLTLDYLRVREQFGKPIGGFQALQHRATEIKILLELSRAGIFATARRFDAGADAAARAGGAARCKLRAAGLAMHVAREVIQMHGAMGMTDEADIGLFVRKALTEASLFGSRGEQKRILAGLMDQEAA